MVEIHFDRLQCPDIVSRSHHLTRPPPAALQVETSAKSRMRHEITRVLAIYHALLLSLPREKRAYRDEVGSYTPVQVLKP